jgi:hypothetical protein
MGRIITELTFKDRLEVISSSAQESIPKIGKEINHRHESTKALLTSVG